MTRKRFAAVFAMLLMFGAAPALRADVKTEERNQVTFAGMLGRIAGLFGGRAVREGIVSTVAVSGDRKMTTSDATGQIVDLKEEKIYDLDLRRKTYTVTTFDEMRRRMQEMQSKAEASARESPDTTRSEGAKEYEVDFVVKETGKTRPISGFESRQVIATVTVREKGKTIEQGGGVVMTADNWLARTVPALSEITAFDRRYFERLNGPMTAVDAQQMATALAMMPGLKEALARYNSESMDGTPLNSVLTLEAVRSEEQLKAQAPGRESDQPPTSIGGAIGGLIRRRGNQNAAANPARATFMTITHEVLKIATTPADVALPAGFTQR